MNGRLDPKCETHSERLQRQKYEARLRLNELAPVIRELKKILTSYQDIYAREYCKFARADEALAMEDGRYHKVETPSGKKGARKLGEYSAEELLSKMSKEQLLQMKELLAEEEGEGIDIETE